MALEETITREEFVALRDQQQGHIEEARALLRRLHDPDDPIDGVARFDAVREYELPKTVIRGETAILAAMADAAKAAARGVSAPKVPYAKALRGRLTRQVAGHSKRKRRRDR